MMINCLSDISSLHAAIEYRLDEHWDNLIVGYMTVSNRENMLGVGFLEKELCNFLY